MHNAKALPFALLLSTPLVVPAHAQEADRPTLPAVNVVGAQDDGYTTPDATSGTKTNAPLRDVPQTINVVPARVLEDQHVNSMQDALKNVPGVSFSHGDGQRDQVSIRGFSAMTDQYVDGFRDDALYFRDLSNIERVDVIKGPAAVLYGRGSAGGLINRISKKPGRNITAANLSLGSWKDRRLEADLGRTTGDQSLSWRLTGAIEKADSYRHQQFLDRKAIAPSAQIRFSPDTQVLLQAEYLNDRRVTDFGIPAYQGRPVNVDPGTYYGAANARDADYNTPRSRPTPASSPIASTTPCRCEMPPATTTTNWTATTPPPPRSTPPPAPSASHTATSSGVNTAGATRPNSPSKPTWAA